ncbi:hypothetical protein GYH30_030496 [Glycine max]|nr:hypothetical protein GYH30_030496 [Glycine max]
MISAYGYHGKGEKAIKLFHEMCESGAMVSKSTFVSLLSACSHSGLVNQGIRYYECCWRNMEYNLRLNTKFMWLAC